MGSIFLVFSPTSSFGGYPLNWLAVLVILRIIPSSFYLSLRKFSILFFFIPQTLSKEFKTSLGGIKTPGLPHFFVSMFILICLSNFMGLFPYVFTPTSHLSITISLSIPLWLGYIIYSTLKNINFFLSHLVPTGTPYILIPFIVLIEIVRRFIRPITLSVRLAANMMAGHLLIVLIRRPIFGISWLLSGAVIFGLLLLILLELAVSFIQRYVFRTLLSLYIIESNSPNFNNRK